MNYLLVVCIVLASMGFESAQKIPPACSSLKPVEIDYSELIRLSPFYVYRSNVPIYKCALVAFVGPADDRNDYNGTAVIVQGNYTFSYEIKITGNTTFGTILCQSGIKASYQTVYTNMRSPKASFCVTICDPRDPTNYAFLACLGRSSADEEDIDRYLSTTLNGVKGVESMQSDCPKPQYCNAFTN